MSSSEKSPAPMPPWQTSTAWFTVAASGSSLNTRPWMALYVSWSYFSSTCAHTAALSNASLYSIPPTSSLKPYTVLTASSSWLPRSSHTWPRHESR